jgi:hypothetical protein
MYISISNKHKTIDLILLKASLNSLSSCRQSLLLIELIKQVNNLIYILEINLFFSGYQKVIVMFLN